jgi:HD-like signal output (HDOD) protein
VLPKQSQETILGFSFAEVSASLLQQWLIPDSLVSTIAMQHHDDAPAVTVESQIMQLAYALAVVHTYPEYYKTELHVPEFLYASLGLEVDALEDAYGQCKEQYEALASVFKMATAEAA